MEDSITLSELLLLAVNISSATCKTHIAAACNKTTKMV